MDHLIEDGLRVFVAVQAVENITHERLLIGSEDGSDTVRHDHPVVIHFGTQRVIEAETDFLPLISREAFEELRREGFT